MSRPPAPRGTRKPPAERSAEILEAARSLALEHGLAAVTLRAVAARAAVTPALIAHYEPSMDALVARTFATIVAAEIGEIGELTTGLAPREELRVVLDTLLDGSRADVTVIWVEAWTLGRRNEPLAASVREQMDAWQAVLQEILESGVATGGFTVDDAPATAWLLLGLIDGFTAQSLVRWGGAGGAGAAGGSRAVVARAIATFVGLPPTAFG
ncbi:TetR/AcrR family transcriptional regulator [Leifsonia sp. YAF41]|uniref:TetR/AcrR family transcriptional regulator n=1 Tax=Leifsonia sp. YAF41 TaxID=3233086 RepID=UPI003F973390